MLQQFSMSIISQTVEGLASRSDRCDTTTRLRMVGFFRQRRTLQSNPATTSKSTTTRQVKPTRATVITGVIEGLLLEDAHSVALIQSVPLFSSSSPQFGPKNPGLHLQQG